MFFTVLGLCLLSLLNERTGLPYIIGTLMILGFGFALFFCLGFQNLFFGYLFRHWRRLDFFEGGEIGQRSGAHERVRGSCEPDQQVEAAVVGRFAGDFSEGPREDRRQQEALTDRLYQQIGQLKVELDWLKKKLALTLEEKRAVVEPVHEQISLRRSVSCWV
jgi:hypothetical protein